MRGDTPGHARHGRREVSLFIFIAISADITLITRQEVYTPILMLCGQHTRFLFDAVRRADDTCQAPRAMNATPTRAAATRLPSKDRRAVMLSALTFCMPLDAFH